MPSTIDAKRPYLADFSAKISTDKSDEPNNASFFKAIGLTKPEKKVDEQKKDGFETDVFLQLIIKQLECQNPLNPEEGADFVAQLAQVNSVEQLKKVNKSIQDVATSFRANRIMGATSMINKSMKVLTNKMKLSSHKENGQLKAEPSKCDIQIPIPKNQGKFLAYKKEIVATSNNEIVFSSVIADQDKIPKPGVTDIFTWDGTNETGERVKDHNGQPIKDGDYQLQVTLLVDGKNGKEWIPADTYVNTKIDSVSVNDKGEISFAAAGIGKINFDQLKEVSSAESLHNAAASEISAETIAEALVKAIEVSDAKIAKKTAEQASAAEQTQTQDGNSNDYSI